MHHRGFVGGQEQSGYLGWEVGKGCREFQVTSADSFIVLNEENGQCGVHGWRMVSAGPPVLVEDRGSF